MDDFIGKQNTLGVYYQGSSDDIDILLQGNILNVTQQKFIRRTLKHKKVCDLHDLSLNQKKLFLLPRKEEKFFYLVKNNKYQGFS